MLFIKELLNLFWHPEIVSSNPSECFKDIFHMNLLQIFLQKEAEDGLSCINIWTEKSTHRQVEEQAYTKRADRRCSPVDSYRSGYERWPCR